jgi:hypothetical protein
MNHHPLETWHLEALPGRHVEPAGLGHRAAFVPMHPDLPERPKGFGILLRVCPRTKRLRACVGLRHGVAKALSLHAVGEDPLAFYKRHYPRSEGEWMTGIAVTDVVDVGEKFATVFKGASRSAPLLAEAKKVCRSGFRWGLARAGTFEAPVCRVNVAVEMYLTTELDEHGCIRNVVLEGI